MKILALSLLVPVAICNVAAAAQPGAAGATAGGPASTASPIAPRTTATASLASAPGSSVKGDLTLKNEGTAVSIRGEITGLAPGKEHGFHVHELGECSLPDFKSAGEHFNPTKDPHGGPKSSARHLGDIANVKADSNGKASVDISLKGVTLQDKDGAPTEILGKALVVHAKADDYKTQPSGDSGDRIACGVIR